MRLLTWLTLLYGGVLVAALAAALTTICVLLWRVSLVLGEVRRSLSLVAEATVTLDPQLAHLSSAAVAAAESLASARNDLSRAIQHVRERAGFAGESVRHSGSG